MHVPGRVKVGGRTWRIDAGSDGAEDADSWGLTLPKRQLIQLDGHAPPEKQRESLLHEILHAISGSKYREGVALSEAQISLLACDLFQVVNDNPEVVRFIAGLE